VLLSLLLLSLWRLESEPPPTDGLLMLMPAALQPETKAKGDTSVKYTGAQMELERLLSMVDRPLVVEESEPPPTMTRQSTHVLSCRAFWFVQRRVAELQGLKSLTGSRNRFYAV
jgi:hypothetical protein